ncbi:PAS domain-containing protein [Acidovorax sp. ACV01]|uniref:PAS domain-containing protein n=1 Tax=Acidovorax sp. ACV01 TaxID=2769311 RepID=UPI00177E87FD|nr:PAS domain-containing protein [Acidovorax sp. ACV01]MBD9391473.1 PAS domain-containing protein [Acidovorax sp. ACV01]
MAITLLVAMAGFARTADQLMQWRLETDKIRALAENDATRAYLEAQRLQAEIPDGALPLDRAQVFNLLSRCELYLALLENASQHANEALVLAKQHSDPTGQAQAYLNIALIAVNQGRLEAMEVATSNALTILEGTDRPDLVGEAMLRASTMYRRNGQFDASVAIATQAMEIAQRKEEPLPLAYAHQGLAISYELSGNNTEALDHFSRMLEQARKAQSRQLEAYALLGIATTNSNLGNHSAAEPSVRQAIALFRSTGAPFNLNLGLFGLANVLRKQGDLVQSVAQLNEVESTYRRYPNPLGMWWMLHLRSSDLLSLGRISAATTDAEAAQALAKNIGLPLYLSESAKRRASVAAARGEHKRAYELLLEAASITTAAEQKKLSERMLELAARYESEGKRRQIDELTRDAQQHELEHRWLWTILAASATLLVMAAYFLYRQLQSHRTLHALNGELQRSTSKLKATLDAMPDLLFELGVDGRYYDYHSPRTDLLATPAAELLGRTVADVLPPRAAQVCLAALQEAHEAGISTGRQLSLKLPHGKAWFELSVARKSVGPDQAPRFIVLSRDITERKRFEAREKVRLEIFELLAQGAGLDVVLVHVAQYVERERPELACSIVLLDGDGQHLYAGRVSTVHHALWSEPITGAGGAQLGLLAIGASQGGGHSGVDRELAREASHLAAGVIERIQMESALAASEREFRTLAENTPDNVVRYDTRCRRTYVNGAMAKLLGTDAVVRLVGATPSESFSGNCRGAVEYEDKLRRVLATGEPEAIEVTTRKGVNQGNTYSVRLVAERDSEGQIVGALAIGRDITEHKRKEALIEESRDMLRELAVRGDTAREEERKRIAREIHDELGQMLTAQRLDISTLKLQFGRDNPVLAERCQNLKDITDHTIQVVRSIASALRPASLDMGITAALEWLTADFRMRTGLVCELLAREEDLDFSEDQSIAVFRIVQESLTNIARHAQARAVEVAIEATEDRYRLSIRDDGVGFDPESVRSRSFGLVGIRERALMLHGEARFVSASGMGTSVEIHIPRRLPKQSMP